MHCLAELEMTDEQAKIINFNDISASSWFCVIPVYNADINLCLSKVVHARTLNVEKAEEANLLYFDKDKLHLAIQCGWVHLVKSASTFSDPNYSVSFHDPLISVLSLSTLVSLSHNSIVPVSPNLISIGFQSVWYWECMPVHQPLLLRDGITHPEIPHLHCRRLLAMADHSLYFLGLHFWFESLPTPRGAAPHTSAYQGLSSENLQRLN